MDNVIDQSGVWSMSLTFLFMKNKETVFSNLVESVLLYNYNHWFVTYCTLFLCLLSSKIAITCS